MNILTEEPSWRAARWFQLIMWFHAADSSALDSAAHGRQAPRRVSKWTLCLKLLRALLFPRSQNIPRLTKRQRHPENVVDFTTCAANTVSVCKHSKGTCLNLDCYRSSCLVYSRLEIRLDMLCVPLLTSTGVSGRKKKKKKKNLRVKNSFGANSDTETPSGILCPGRELSWNDRFLATMVG